MEILSLPENEPFITGIEESIDICSNQIIKLADASIFHCRSGKAHIEIDLQAYEVTENTQLLLLPGSIFSHCALGHQLRHGVIIAVGENDAQRIVVLAQHTSSPSLTE